MASGAHASLLLTRVVIASVFLWHGIPKAFNIAAAMAKFAGFGLPPILGPITGWIEVVAAPLLLLGLFHHTAVFSLLVVIVGALVTVQIPNGVSAGLERDLMILTGLALLAFLGPGRFALSVKHLQVPIQQKTRLTAER
ncbi:MAG: DoxX family protein [Gemmatimonadota bacterium]|jgi:uncharacterized membrane protein YphA (DoxX/SURF4 family)